MPKRRVSSRLGSFVITGYYRRGSGGWTRREGGWMRREVADESKCCVRLVLVDIYIYNKIKTHRGSRTRLEPRRRCHLFLSLPNPSLLFVHVVCPYIISIE